MNPQDRQSADGSLTPLDLTALRFRPLAERPSKVHRADLGCPTGPNPTLSDWLDGLPDLLAVRGLKQLRDAVVDAHEDGRPIVAALGGHVVKTGCAPYLIDWIDRGLLSALALTGSAAIHDLELAIAGKTSEEVGPGLIDGSFGFAQETSALFVEACASSATRNVGLGEALGETISRTGGPGLDDSLIIAARRAGIPVTVHVAIGTDVVHMTPDLDGASLGAATLADFRTICQVVAGMSGGVWMNLGSAVVLPEVFLKALSIARNLGQPLDGLTTANLDFEQKYRGTLNVLQRPGARAVALTGHHELMIPLLHAAVVTRIAAVGELPEPIASLRNLRLDQGTVAPGPHSPAAVAPSRAEPLG
ncbi:MAG: hypothetical protein AB7I30_21665 [Isosphaeraceae bacterium]